MLLSGVGLPPLPAIAKWWGLVLMVIGAVALTALVAFDPDEPPTT
jgi:hypothetical protein